MKHAPLHLQEINRARDYYNPLRGLNIPRVVNLLDDAERGKYDELQKLNRMTEKRHPTLKGLKARRLSALKKLDWDVKIPDPLPAGVTAAQAAAQQSYLRTQYDLIENLPQTFECLALPSFRGYTHLEKRHQDDDPSQPITRLNFVPQWHWLRDPNTWEWKYDPNARHDLARAVPIDPANFIIREVDDPLCEIALLCYLRRGLAKKDWTSFVEDYGIASIFAMLGENTPLDKVQEWLAIMRQVTSNSRGALPPGSKVEALDVPGMSGEQFENFIKAEDADLVLAGTGGLLSMLTANTGLGDKGQGDNHEKAFDTIAQAEAMEISAIMQQQFDRPILQREFPSQPVIAYFELAARDEEDVAALAENAVKWKAAGLVVDAEEMSEKSNMKLTRAAEQQPEPGNPTGQPTDQPADKAKPPFKNRADAVSVVFDRNSTRELSAAQIEAVGPLLDRVAAVKDVPDAEMTAWLEQFQRELPALFDAARAIAPDVAAVWADVLTTAFADGFADRPAISPTRPENASADTKTAAPPSQGRQGAS